MAKTSRYYWRKAVSVGALTLAVLFQPGLSALCEQMAVIPAEEAGREAHIVSRGINWHTSLEDAQAVARKEGKLVFWMHMLGSVDGDT